MDNFDSLKLAANQIAGYYALSDREDFHAYAERILNCAPHFDFKLEPGFELFGGLLLAHVQNVRWCRCRQCPLCQWAKVSKLRARFFKGLTRLFSDYPNHRWLFLTLTVANCPVSDLRVVVDSMSHSWHRFIRRRSLPVTGYIRSLEITRSGSGEAHPHYHVLLLVPPEYFSKYLRVEDWATMWRESAGLDYQPVIYLRSVRLRSNQDWLGALLEVVKYSVKPADLVSEPDWLYTITDQLHRVRSLTVGGLVARYISQSQLDLVDAGSKTGDEESQLGIPVSLDWDFHAEAYQFSTIGSVVL